MAYRNMVQRIIHEAKCVCGWETHVDKDPPRERKCPRCGAWVPFKETAVTGPDFSPPPSQVRTPYRNR